MAVYQPMLAELHNVSKRYGHQWALNQLSMNVEEGETLLLTGHNGAGKTTLLRLLATVMRPTHGTIKILGQDSRHGFEEIRPHIGLLSHQNHLYNQLNAYENLELVAKLSGKSIEIIPELLEQVNLQQKSKKVVVLVFFNHGPHFFIIYGHFKNLVSALRHL